MRTIKRTDKISGRVRVPGDKSISHRAAMLSALADGASHLSGFLESEDCLNTLKAMEALGAGVRRRPDGTISILGTAGHFRQPQSVLDMGNSGTGIRLLAGLLAGQNITVEMTGDASLRSRPMRRISNPLEQMGASIELLGENGCAPIRVNPGSVKPIRYELPVASAQVKSAVLLAGLATDGKTVVVEPRPTRDHTERMLIAMGADLKVDGPEVTLNGNPENRLQGGSWQVPGDFSSAAFWLTAAAASEGGELVIEKVGLNPRRTALLDVLRRMGAEIEVEQEESGWEPIGTVRVRGRHLTATVIEGDEIPNLIDELPIVSVAAALADGDTVIRDAAELRVKESDRIAVMARNLTAAGVAVEEMPDGMVISGGSRIRGGMVADSFGDHRVAMSMAILGLFAELPITVTNEACIATSYPQFWDHLALLSGSC